jgi:fatty acid desaturase
MSGTPRRNPFRNEADAFRILVIVLITAAVVIAAAKLIDGWVGAALGIIALVVAAWSVAGWLRAELAERDG